jgi:nascent polypeptide-associated complex subunit alpha
MGIDIDDIDAEEVVIRTADEELVFTDAEVQRMVAQGQETYNVVGEPERTDRSGDTSTDDEPDEAADEGIPEADIQMVVDATGASASEAREALEAADGLPADAIDRLQ